MIIQIYYTFLVILTSFLSVIKEIILVKLIAQICECDITSSALTITYMGLKKRPGSFLYKYI